MAARSRDSQNKIKLQAVVLRAAVGGYISPIESAIRVCVTEGKSNPKDILDAFPEDLDVKVCSKYDEDVDVNSMNEVGRCIGWVSLKGGIEGLAGLANAVPLSEAVCTARPLFSCGHTHLICTCLIKQHSVNYTVDHNDNQNIPKALK